MGGVEERDLRRGRALKEVSEEGMATLAIGSSP